MSSIPRDCAGNQTGDGDSENHLRQPGESGRHPMSHGSGFSRTPRERAKHGCSDVHFHYTGSVLSTASLITPRKLGSYSSPTWFTLHNPDSQISSPGCVSPASLPSEHRRRPAGIAEECNRVQFDVGSPAAVARFVVDVHPEGGYADNHLPEAPSRVRRAAFSLRTRPCPSGDARRVVARASPIRVLKTEPRWSRHPRGSSVSRLDTFGVGPRATYRFPRKQRES